MSIDIRDTEFDPCAELRRYEEEILRGGGKFGATVSFVGSMRDFNDNESVHAMTLEHYPGMTDAHLERIVEEAKRRWDILDALIVHRVGELRPGDPIVLVATWSAHREPAFAACRYMIEELKTRAPFWKKEQRPTAARWVEHNTPAEKRITS
ncbi:MAG TPA: molybdenum cofactor biosynthesis protein MoaE [Burkholderiaceae bacterium]|nr:molybdenum cofactor biosynthesis protein MoaE [Burkholderiaceae bacterium]